MCSNYIAAAQFQQLSAEYIEAQNLSISKLDDENATMAEQFTAYLSAMKESQLTQNQLQMMTIESNHLSQIRAIDEYLTLHCHNLHRMIRINCAYLTLHCKLWQWRVR